MSDRLTNIEIEDVLTSIRRLVSQDARPAAGGAEAPVAVPRLVLTQALRVHPQPEPTPAAAPDTAPEPPRESTLEHRIVELEEMLASRAQDFEPDIGDDLDLASVIDWPSREPQAPEARFIDADAADETVPTSEQEQSTDTSDDDAAASTPLDEAVLRAIIREVVLEELQGPLGARITRNLRRLIRTEIARVAAQNDVL